VNNPYFVADILKLNQIKETSGLEYSEAIAEYEQTTLKQPPKGA
jgi:hypothetical protein